MEPERLKHTIRPREPNVPHTPCGPHFTGKITGIPGQSKHHSLFECILNIIIGFVVAILAQRFIFPFYDVHISIQDNLEIGGWLTLVSLARQYVLIRFFNDITTKEN